MTRMSASAINTNSVRAALVEAPVFLRRGSQRKDGPSTSSGRTGNGRSYHRAQGEVAELLAALDVRGLRHHPGAHQREADVGRGIDPEYRAAGAVVTVRLGGGECAEQVVEHARPAHLEADALVGR